MVPVYPILVIRWKTSTAADHPAVYEHLMGSLQTSDIQDYRLAEKVAFMAYEKRGVRLEPCAIPGVTVERATARNRDRLPFLSVPRNQGNKKQ
jgi:hypothetical protein